MYIKELTFLKSEERPGPTKQATAALQKVNEHSIVL